MRRWAERLEKVEASPHHDSPSFDLTVSEGVVHQVERMQLDPIPEGESRFLVVRLKTAGPVPLYDGPKGGYAAKMFLSLRRKNPQAVYGFVHDGIVRDWHPHTELIHRALLAHYPPST